MRQNGRLLDVLYRISVCGLAVFVLLVLYNVKRIYWFDQFIIPSASMQPTLQPGDRVLVNKRILGARIYTSFDFSEGAPLQCRRTAGKRRLRPGDLIVFNHPMPHKRGDIAFKINYVYAKRVVGTPGDTIGIRGGYYYNNRHDGILGVESMQAQLAAWPDSLLRDRPGHFMPSFLGMDFPWTIRDAGPLIVPGQGITVKLDSVNFCIYSPVVRFETKTEWEYIPALQSACNASGDTISAYTFAGDYYFACGDHVTDSNDSRYWGFVPEDFVVGVITRISWSRNPATGRINWDRCWKKMAY